MAANKYIKENSKFKIQNSKLILAVPVIAKDTFNKLKSEVENIVALEIPESFNAVGQFYQEFPQISDEEVMQLL